MLGTDTLADVEMSVNRSRTVAEHGAVAAGTVAAAGEFGLVAAVIARLPQGAGVLLGPGDDAAVVAAVDGRVVASTDLLIERRHFRRDWSSAADIGHKAAAQSLADIAAMGAVPTALLVGLAAPPDLSMDWALELTDGLRAECDLVGASVVGGDVTRAEMVVVAVSALGSLQGRQPVRRAGARVGDVVAVAGRLGWAEAGFAVLTRGFRSPRLLVGAHRRPEPPYAAGPEAAVLRATSLVDVSDGLIADLGHVASASGVGMDLRSVQFEVAEVLRDAGSALGVDPLRWVLAGGDDHALAATFPAQTALPPHWRVVGSVIEGDSVTVDGRGWEGPGGHTHFA
jgi:thiamine-monophosphate kinase